MALEEVIYLLAGSTFGLTLRLYIQYNFRKKIGFYLDNSSIVNILASLLLGILVALNPINKDLFLLFYVGFLGCLSTFSSFIYQLFKLIKSRKYLRLLFYYFEVIILSFLFFCIGHYIILTCNF